MATRKTFSNWTTEEIPSQAGRRALITGTSPNGLGFETAVALARAGAEVLLASRNEQKNAQALAALQSAVPGANARTEPLDLASLASVKALADRLLAEDKPLDLLVLNAAVMATPKRQVTADGFELQLGTNFIGHFALAARLLPLLQRGHDTRVVSLSSVAHRTGRIHLDDLQLERGYTPWKAYGQSKLAMLMFALELERQALARGWKLHAFAAHPGFATTELIANGPGGGGLTGLLSMMMKPLLSHSPARGALPTLFAATSPEARAGGYYGPVGMFELKGGPAEAAIAKQARDESVAKQLWQRAEELTGVRFA